MKEKCQNCLNQDCRSEKTRESIDNSILDKGINFRWASIFAGMLILAILKLFTEMR